MFNALNDVIVNAMDYVLGWILYLPRDVQLFLVAILTSAILTFSRLFSTDQPWLRQAKRESEARRNVGILFDDNRLTQETGRALLRLRELQRNDGAWPWFPGGPANDYITLYITTGFGRLRHLGVDLDVAPARKALGRLDSWIDEIYQEILRRGTKEKNHLSPVIALSASVTKADIEKGLKAGFKTYLTKPINVREVITAIQNFLALQQDNDERKSAG